MQLRQRALCLCGIGGADLEEQDIFPEKVMVQLRAEVRSLGEDEDANMVKTHGRIGGEEDKRCWNLVKQASTVVVLSYTSLCHFLYQERD